MGIRQTLLMNITVKTYGSGLLCRPDTTWERENKDFYSPGFVQEIRYAPVVFARICKAGKCISGKFAARYYDGLNFGMLLYPAFKDEPWNTASSSILDHTSFLPFPLYQPVVFGSSGNGFRIMKDGMPLFCTETRDGYFIRLVEECLTEASAYVSQRIGDLVAVELAGPEKLMGEDEKKAEISAFFCENELFRLSIFK